MNADKRDVVAAYLQLGLTAIALDSRQPGVVVPEHLRQRDLILRISYKFSPPDLQVSDWGVRCTLTFTGAPAFVEVPWEAIYGTRSLVTDHTTTWDGPPEPPTLTKRRGILGLVQ